MCGIAGILNFDGQACDPGDLRVFTDTLRHRGPDGGGVHVDGPLGLGHRRLAIVDLADSGAQPMAYGNDRYWITYNGEVYNFLELRRELEGLGHRFRSTSDTEVILAGYRQWGADCVLRFNGMWAFAIWDSESRELFLSCDRFGIKPLNYFVDGRRFAFASELKAFLQLRGFSARPNESTVRRALSSGQEPVEETLLHGVSRLRAGHNMVVNAAGVRSWQWWQTLDHLPDVPRTFAGQAERFRELFFDSCRLRLRSDVPVATCLSGGLDSSSILCSLAEMGTEAGPANDRLTSDYHRAFVATFPGTRWDERRFAEAAIAQAGALPRYLPIGPEAAVENLHQFAFDFENIGGALLIPLWYTYRALRRDGVVVSLDGHGGDELLGGYGSAVEATLKARGVIRSPARAGSLIRTLAGMYAAGPFGDDYLRDVVMSSDPFLRALRTGYRRAGGLARRSWRAVTGASSRQPPLAPAPWVSGEVNADPGMADEARAAIDLLGPLDRVLYRQFHHTSLPSILRKFDRCSMAHGVEVRMPFMDWRIVCYGFALPETSKVGGGFGKRVLREAMRGVLPELIRTRRDKIGFISPLPNWFNGGLGDWIWDTVQTASFLQSDVWDGPAIRDFVGPRHRARNWTEGDCNRVWKFLQAHLWQQAFFS